MTSTAGASDAGAVPSAATATLHLSATRQTRRRSSMPEDLTVGPGGRVWGEAHKKLEGANRRSPRRARRVTGAPHSTARAAEPDTADRFLGERRLRTRVSRRSHWINDSRCLPPDRARAERAAPRDGEATQLARTYGSDHALGLDIESGELSFSTAQASRKQSLPGADCSATS